MLFLFLDLLFLCLELLLLFRESLFLFLDLLFLCFSLFLEISFSFLENNVFESGHFVVGVWVLGSVFFWIFCVGLWKIIKAKEKF